MNNPFFANADPAGNMFQQAMAGFQSAISTGAKLQEESLKGYAQLFRDFTAAPPWQQGAQGLMQEAVRATQQNLDESIRLVHDCSQRMAGLWQKAVEKQQSQAAASDSGGGPWEFALTALRTNTQAILQANTRILDAWSQLAKEMAGHMQSFQDEVRKAAEETQQTVQEAQRRAAEQAQQAVRAAQQMAANQTPQAVNN